MNVPPSEGNTPQNNAIDFNDIGYFGDKNTIEVRRIKTSKRYKVL